MHKLSNSSNGGYSKKQSAKYPDLDEGMLLVNAALHHRTLTLALSVLSLSFDCLATQI